MECAIVEFINGQKFRKVYEKKCESLVIKYDLKKIELDILFILNKYEHFDTARDIVKHSCLSKAHVSKAIEHLIQRNYLVTAIDRGDRRCLHLAVTDQAQPIIEELNFIWGNMIQIIYDGFTEEEKNTLRNAFVKISKNIDSEMIE